MAVDLDSSIVDLFDRRGFFIRDQYGFKKSYQWISREKYAEFEAVYSRIQARRKIKWDALLTENGGLFPSRNSKSKFCN